MNVATSILNEPSIILGVVAFVGLIFQKKPLTKVFEGTLKTVIGFLVFNLEGNAIVGALKGFNTLFQVGSHVNGVVAISEATVVLTKENCGHVVSVTLIMAFVANLLFARFTRFKNIVLLVNTQFMFGAVLTLIIKSHGYSDAAAILVGGTSIGLTPTLLSKLCQPFARKVIGSDDMIIGHFSMCAYALSGYIGKLLSKYENESTEGLKFPGWLFLFKDFTFGMSVIMLILFYIASFTAGQQTTQEMAGSVYWIVWSFIQAVTFTAGMNVLMYGVRVFLAEIIAAFIFISEKIIPNARPALDCPILFPYAPTSVMPGFLFAYIASLMAAFAMASINTSVVFIPAVNVCLFLRGTAGMLGNPTDGWRGAIAGSLMTGLLLPFLPLAMCPVLTGMGVVQPAFPAVGYNMVNITIHGILTLVGKIFWYLIRRIWAYDKILFDRSRGTAKKGEADTGGINRYYHGGAPEPGDRENGPGEPRCPGDLWRP